MERNVERMRVLDHSWVLFLSLWSVLFPRLLVVRHCRRCCCRRRCRRRRCCRCAPCSFRPSARDHDHKWAARGPRGASGAPGASGTVLGPSCVVLGLSWKLLGLSWSGIRGRLRAILEGPRRPGSAPGPPGRPFVVVVAASGPPRRRRRPPPPPPPLPRSIPPRSPLLFLPLDAASSKKIPAPPPPPHPALPCSPHSWVLLGPCGGGSWVLLGPLTGHLHPSAGLVWKLSDACSLGKISGPESNNGGIVLLGASLGALLGSSWAP